MLHMLQRGATGFATVECGPGWLMPPDALWLDLEKPTREEELAVEQALGLQLPTPDEMAQIEPSSRLYQENGATFGTATLVARSQDEHPVTAPVTFVLTRGVLVTLRYEPLRAFAVHAERAGGAANGAETLLGLLDAVVERMAEILEWIQGQVDDTSHAIFHRPKGGAFTFLLTGLARAQSITAMTGSGLVSLGRLVSFLGLAPEIAPDEGRRTHLGSLQHDIQSLSEHAAHQSGQMSFLLDAALGLINIEQNEIIKVFSLFTIAFLPPTLIGAIYGMNFAHMPELSWRFGYLLAILLMLMSSAAPLLWFRRKGWL